MTGYFVGFLAVMAFVSSSVVAQDETLASAARDRFVISAKAGGVNYVEGTVGLARKRGGGGRLIKGDTLEIGDRVSTGPDGRAEILLNPGSFIRIGPNSAFQFVTTSLDDLRLRVDRGSAVLEVFAAEDFRVGVTAGKGRYDIISTGIYRIDVSDNGTARLRVWEGLARTGPGTEVKRGRAATTNAAGAPVVAKFDRDEKDALDIWSKTRGKELAKLSSKLKRDSVRAAMMRSFLGRGWNLHSSFGLWVYDPFYGGYCFVPFGYGWSSPYGYWYGHHLGWYNLPTVVYWPQTTGGGTSQPAATPIVTSGDRSPVPPFIRMQQTMGGGGRGGFGNSNSGGWNDSGSSSTPVYTPPPPPPPPPSVAPTSRTDSSDTGARRP